MALPLLPRSALMILLRPVISRLCGGNAAGNVAVLDIEGFGMTLEEAELFFAICRVFQDDILMVGELSSNSE